MHFGMFMQFETRPGSSQAGAFSEGFELVDTAEACGLDGAWLAEMHFNARPFRAVVTHHHRQQHRYPHPAAAHRHGRVRPAPEQPPAHRGGSRHGDQISEAASTSASGAAGFARSYDIYGVPYAESRDRFREALDIIMQAWQGEPFSYDGKYHQVSNATVAPLPYQKPHPPFRMAATTAETFPRAGADGYPIFVGLRGMDIPELRGQPQGVPQSLARRRTRRRWRRFPARPVYVGLTEKAAIEEPFESIQNYLAHGPPLRRRLRFGRHPGNGTARPARRPPFRPQLRRHPCKPR